MNAKCFKVSDYCAEVDILVWAESRGKAKSIAQGESDWFCNTDYTELTCVREPEFDGLRPMGYCFGNHLTDDDIRLMQNAGWYEYEGNPIPCSQCGLYVWFRLPESHIENGICLSCREKMKGERG